MRILEWTVMTKAFFKVILLLWVPFWATDAFSANLPEEVLWLQSPSGETDPVQVAKTPETFAWKSIRLKSAIMFPANTLNIFRFRVDLEGQSPQVMRFNTGRIGNRSHGFKTEVFSNDQGELKALNPAEIRRPSFYVTAEETQHEIYLVFVSPEIPVMSKFDMSIMDLDTFESTKDREAITLGASTGIIVIMILYNLGMYLFMRKVYILYYISFSLGCLYWVLLRYGAVSLVGYSFYLQIIAGEMITISAIYFTFELLNQKNIHPKLYRYSRYSVLVSLMLSLGICLGFHQALKPAYIMAAVNLGISTVPVFLAAREGDRPSYIILAGWMGFFFIGILIALGFMLDGLPDFSRYIPYAVAFEIATSSFAMGQRMHLTEQKMTLENKHAFDQLAKIVYPHQIESIRQQRELESTMPTQPAQAFVICFDIIESSKLESPYAKTFFRNVFARCNELMAQGYDGIHLKASAYRVKEMGDGFLCSVGYPFASLTENPAIEAIELAHRFIQVLEEEARAFPFSKTVACGVGIAFDNLVGFYPETGTREYDVFGAALVLATRYEGLRKAIFEKDRSQSIVIMQECVYSQLDAQHQSQFVEIDLEQRKLIVRDDATARKVYCQFPGSGRLQNNVA